MKRVLLMLILISLCVASWVALLSDYKSGESEWRLVMDRAEESYSKKIYDEAVSEYKRALKIRPDKREALIGLARTYFSLNEYKLSSEYAVKALKTAPDDAETALLAADAYENMSDFKKAYDILKVTSQTDEVKSRIKELRSRYNLKYINIKSCSPWFESEEKELCIVYEESGAGIYDSRGKRLMHSGFYYLGISGDENLYPCVVDGEWCFVDSEGNRRLVTETVYDYLGPFCDGFAVAKKGDTYGYIDRNLQEFSFEFEKAYNFSEGKAVVVKDGCAELINTSFEITTSSSYKDVLSDDYGFSVFDGMIIAFDGEKYCLCDYNLSPKGSFTADYISVPSSAGSPYLAFKDNERWGFVSKEGKVVCEPKFFAAKSFSNGLAAVKINTKWGYVDESFNIVIDENFSFAGDLSSSGTAWISNEAGFALMSLYVF